MSFSKQAFRYSFLFIFLAELISFFGYLYPAINKTAFFSIILAAFIISLYKFEYGLLVLLIELFIGSKGYLFYFEQSGLVISIRIALWLIIISVWLSRFITESVKNKKLDFSFLDKSIRPYFFVLGLFIIWSVVRGLALGNELNNIFFDANGWIYLGLIFPIFYVFNKPLSSAPLGKNDFKELFFAIFTACVLWLCLETFLLLFAYSHNLTGITPELYRWIRSSGVGEITFIKGGFYRIFFQSHIYVLIASLATLLLLVNSEIILKIPANFKSSKLLYFLILSVLMSVNLLTMSRSNWLGLAAGLLSIFLIFIWRKNWRIAGQIAFYSLSSLVIGLVFIVVIVKFPYPRPLGGFNAADLLAERAGQISNEAGVSSRWSLLPELWSKIKLAPILGQGFGSTVTYRSSDPRVLETNPDGLYTTYSFEWGWLDIWLKSGIFGLLSYLLLLYIIIFKYLKKSKSEGFYETAEMGLVAGLLSISIISIFSPYMNHPLGIGYLIIVSALASSKIKNKF